MAPVNSMCTLPFHFLCLAFFCLLTAGIFSGLCSSHLPLDSQCHHPSEELAWPADFMALSLSALSIAHLRPFPHQPHIRPAVEMLWESDAYGDEDPYLSHSPLLHISGDSWSVSKSADTHSQLTSVVLTFSSTCLRHLRQNRCSSNCGVVTSRGMIMNKIGQRKKLKLLLEPV